MGCIRMCLCLYVRIYVGRVCVHIYMGCPYICGQMRHVITEIKLLQHSKCTFYVGTISMTATVASVDKTKGPCKIVVNKGNPGTFN